LGDDANDPLKVKEYIEKRKKLNSLSVGEYIQDAALNIDAQEGTAKHNVDTFFDAFKKEGILSLNT
jgi:hypothetical protein